MEFPRRKFLLAACAVALPSLPRFAKADNYPTKPVRLVVQVPAGSAPDIIARIVGEWMSERMGQQFVIDNRPGASGNIATEAVIRSAPDGYTLLLAMSANAINASLHDNLRFSFERDAAHIASIARIPLALVVNPSVPAKTAPEFIAYAKANPGKVNIASTGTARRCMWLPNCSTFWRASSWSTSPIAASRRRGPICSAVRCRACSRFCRRRFRTSGQGRCGPSA
jgi:tripartite-type tricarboxylate transporter receptor subunit TctC